jgi:hypothetical protein
VGSVYSVSAYGGFVVGGVIARQWGVTGPFWFAFAGSAVLVVLLWRELGHIAPTRSGGALAADSSLVQT